jgi:hypothetical protein
MLHGLVAFRITDFRIRDDTDTLQYLKHADSYEVGYAASPQRLRPRPSGPRGLGFGELAVLMAGGWVLFATLTPRLCVASGC